MPQQQIFPEAFRPHFISSLEQSERQAKSLCELLMDQHRIIEALFAEMDACDRKQERATKNLFKILREKITMHTKIEEKCFYPQMEKFDLEAIALAKEEHSLVKMLLKKMNAQDPISVKFQGQYNLLKQLVGRHIEEEEEDLFPRWDQGVSTDRADMFFLKARDMVEQSAKTRRSARSAQDLHH